MMNKLILFVMLTLTGLACGVHADVRLKEIGRFSHTYSNELVGYGLVVGLAGSGDSRRNQSTIQSIANTLQEFDINVDAKDLNAKNVASVIVTAVLPPFFNKGDRIDVKVSSMGDARSLNGGVLLLTPLKALNDKIYAMAQGQLSVGGFAFTSFDSSIQKNHPTVGILSNGGLVARDAGQEFIPTDGVVEYVLDEPDVDSITQVMDQLALLLPQQRVEPVHSGKVRIRLPQQNLKEQFKLINAIENIRVEPQRRSKVVINERTGTIVAGGDVKISEVVVSHGSLKLEIKTQYLTSQPNLIAGRNPAIQSLVVPDTSIDVSENQAHAVKVGSGTSVAVLVEQLKVVDATTRDIIVILQMIKRAGALNAELIVE